MYSGGGEGEGSPDTEETELSGDEAVQRRRRGHPMGAINPVMIQNQGKVGGRKLRRLCDFSQSLL